MITRVLSWIDTLSEWSGRVVSALIYAIMGTLVYEIVARYAFDSPTIWAHEASGFFFGAYFMLGAAFCLRREGMISVDLIYRTLPRRTQAILDVITFVFFLGVCVTLIWHGGLKAIHAWRIEEHTNTTWMPPLYPLRTVIPVAGLLLVLQGIAKFIRDANIALFGRELGETE